jgi:hypothetical protein
VARRGCTGLDPLEDGEGELLAALAVMLVEQLELQRAEEALADRVIETLTG